MSKNKEEMLQLSVQEATEALLMSQSSVYSWIERGKLKTEEQPSGKVIVISSKEAEKIRECNLKSRRNKVSKQIQKNSDNLQENTANVVENYRNYEENVTIDAEVEEVSTQTVDMTGFATGNQEFYGGQGGSNSSVKETFELAKLIADLSAKAGKYELLADLQKQNKDDVDYWKEQYFALKAELEAIKADNARIKAELEQRKKGFFGVFHK